MQAGARSKYALALGLAGAWKQEGFEAGADLCLRMLALALQGGGDTSEGRGWEVWPPRARDQGQVTLAGRSRRRRQKSSSSEQLMG